LGQLLLINFHAGLGVFVVELVQASSNLENRALSLGFLHAQILDFLSDSVKFSLLVDADTLGVVVLLLNLTQLS
jgi:hypothetical protein